MCLSNKIYAAKSIQITQALQQLEYNFTFKLVSEQAKIFQKIPCKVIKKNPPHF